MQNYIEICHLNNGNILLEGVGLRVREGLWREGVLDYINPVLCWMRTSSSPVGLMVPSHPHSQAGVRSQSLWRTRLCTKSVL